MAINSIFITVPQQKVYVVERFGKFHKLLQPGLNFLIPLADKIRYTQSLKETAYLVPHQTAITADNVSLELDGVLFTRVIDPYKASYNVSEVSKAVEALAQTTMRSEIGFLTLDNVLRERQALNQHITQAINEAALEWGITCFRYEIKDIRPPRNVLQAMEKQLNAERTKRAAILDSEGLRESAVNSAQGKKSSAILSAEAEKSSAILKGEAQAENLRRIAEGKKDATKLEAETEHNRITTIADANRTKVLAESEAQKAKMIAAAGAEAARLKLIADTMTATPGGRDAANYMIADAYIKAFKEMGASSNTMIVPSTMSDMSSLATSALSMFQTMSEGSLKPYMNGTK